MKKINHKSDFDFFLSLKDAGGKEIPFPDNDFVAKFYTTNKANAYTVSCIGGECVNCFNDNGKIHVVVNSPRMGIGVLNAEMHVMLPNGIYPDGMQDIYDPQPLDIELVTGAGDYPTTAEVEASLPLVKGEPFTYEDFTPEQIADLKRPATEAAERADKAVRAAEKATQEAVASNKQLAGNVAEAAGAETERVEAETARVTAETQRQSAEDTRKANEVERVKAEGLRDSNEATRESQEAERQSAETGRINAEKARVSAEASRVAAETKRASDFTEAEAQRQSTFESAEAERAQAEATRVSNESIRIGNEQSRVNAEHTRASQETARQDAESARQSNEQSRVTAEGARVEAETVRAAEFAGFADTIAAKQDKITTSEDLALSEANVLSLTDMAKKRLFNDMWDAAFGEYGKYDPANAPDAEHPYLGNGIWMTYEEAKEIMLYYTRRTLNSLYYAYTRSNTRTFIPPKIASTGVSMQMFCANSGRLEKVVFSGNVVGSDMYAAFAGCRRLREIQGVIIAPYADYSAAFNYCERLEEVRIQRLGKSISFKDSSNLSLETVSYLVANASNTAAITITLHPTAYARVTDELFAQAAAKNITIATT